MTKTRFSITSILVIVILILIILLMGGAWVWYFLSGRVGNRDIYDAVQDRGQQMQEHVDRRSDAIETKIDRFSEKERHLKQEQLVQLLKKLHLVM